MNVYPVTFSRRITVYVRADDTLSVTDAAWNTIDDEELDYGWDIDGWKAEVSPALQHHCPATMTVRNGRLVNIADFPEEEVPE